MSISTYFSIFFIYSNKKKISDNIELTKKERINKIIVAVSIYIIILPLFYIIKNLSLATSLSSQLRILEFFAYPFTAFIIGYGVEFLPKDGVTKKDTYALYAIFIQVIIIVLLIGTELIISNEKIIFINYVLVNNSYFRLLILYMSNSVFFLLHNILFIKRRVKLSLLSLMSWSLNVIMFVYFWFKLEDTLSQLGWFTFWLIIFLSLAGMSVVVNTLTEDIP